MATPFQLELVTPERILFSGTAEEVSLRSDGGEIAFLANHADYVGAVDITVVRVDAPQPGGATTTLSSDAATDALRIAVHGGFVEVKDNKVVILAGVAELGSEIDVPRAERALSAAEDQIAAGTSSSDAHDAEAAAAETAKMAGAMIGLLAPDSPEAVARRARVRLEAAGVNSHS